METVGAVMELTAPLWNRLPCYGKSRGVMETVAGAVKSVHFIALAGAIRKIVTIRVNPAPEWSDD